MHSRGQLEKRCRRGPQRRSLGEPDDGRQQLGDGRRSDSRANQLRVEARRGRALVLGLVVPPVFEADPEEGQAALGVRPRERCDDARVEPAADVDGDGHVCPHADADGVVEELSQLGEQLIVAAVRLAGEIEVPPAAGGFDPVAVDAQRATGWGFHRVRLPHWERSGWWGEGLRPLVCS